MLDVLVFCAALFGGGVAAIAGFGIGSVLTPAIALTAGTKLAVAAVSIPHAIGTTIRFLRFRREVDWRIVRSFGAMSALGGLTGAFVNTWTTSRALEIVLGLHRACRFISSPITGNWDPCGRCSPLRPSAS